jgi:hypothetical protein
MYKGMNLHRRQLPGEEREKLILAVSKENGEMYKAAGS